MNRRHITTALKATFLIAVVVVLIRNDLISLESIETAISRWQWVLAGWTCMACTTLVSITRWHFLIRAQRIAIPFRRSLKAAMIGLFFSTFLPGMISGDVVKGYYVVRAIPGQMAATASSILFDRVVGISGLVGLAAIALLLGSGGSWASTLGAPIILAVVGAAAGTTVFYAALLGISAEWDPILKTLRRLAERSRFFHGPLRLYEGVRVYHGEPRVTLLSLAASVAAHSFLVMGWICYVRALSLDGIPTAALFVVVPIGMLLAAIPIGPAGIGTGHAAFLAVFAILGSNRGADLFNVALSFQLLQAGLGGLVYLATRADEPIPQSDTSHPSRQPESMDRS